MAVYEDGAEYVPLSQRAGQAANYAGAGLSLALMIGVGIWGYQLVMRDVSGVPVVRAMEGAMRVAPENPGGDIATHAGLAVNAVAAEGGAAPSEDRVVLAPATTDLAQEDLDVAPLAEEGEVAATDPAPEALVAEPAALTDAEPDAPTEPMTADDILALADQIAAGATPMTALDPAEVVAPQLMVDGQDVQDAVTVISTAIPGVTTSLRPAIRPAAAVAQVSATPAVATDADLAVSEAINAAVSTVALPEGTKLIQLGAFPSAESAAEAWTRLSADFGQYLNGKERLIQEASSGGRAFYRLRAQGFADMAEARRLCAALEAGGADCIPVVTR